MTVQFPAWVFILKDLPNPMVAHVETITSSIHEAILKKFGQKSHIESGIKPLLLDLQSSSASPCKAIHFGYVLRDPDENSWDLLGLELRSLLYHDSINRFNWDSKFLPNFSHLNNHLCIFCNGFTASSSLIEDFHQQRQAAFMTQLMLQKGKNVKADAKDIMRPVMLEIGDVHDDEYQWVVPSVGEVPDSWVYALFPKEEIFPWIYREEEWMRTNVGYLPEKKRLKIPIDKNALIWGDYSKPFLEILSQMAKIKEGSPDEKFKRFEEQITKLNLNWPKKLFETPPENIQEFLDKASEFGIQEADRGHPEEALRIYEDIVKIDPRHAKTWKWMGVERNHLGNSSGASIAFKNYVKIAPDEAAFDFTGMNWSDSKELVNDKRIIPHLDELQSWKVLGAKNAINLETKKANDAFKKAIMKDPDWAVKVLLTHFHKDW